MLVLTRQKDESIIIGDNIEITIVDVKGDKVRLGVKAPNTVSIHRKEVYLAIKQSNIEASQVDFNVLGNLPDISQKGNPFQAQKTSNDSKKKKTKK